MVKHVPNYKLQGMRVDKMFSNSPEAKANRKKNREQKHHEAKQLRALAILRGENVDMSNPLIMETSSSEGQEDVYAG